MSAPDRYLTTGGTGLWETLTEGLQRGDLQPGRERLAAGHPIIYEHPDRDDCVIREYPNRRRELVRYDADGEHIIGSPDERSWQLAMSGDSLDHVTADVRHDIARLFDLLPSVSHLTLETDAGFVHVARDWPSNQMEDADRLTARIVRRDCIAAIVVHDCDTGARRVTGRDGSQA